MCTKITEEISTWSKHIFKTINESWTNFARVFFDFHLRVKYLTRMYVRVCKNKNEKKPTILVPLMIQGMIRLLSDTFTTEAHFGQFISTRSISLTRNNLYITYERNSSSAQISKFRRTKFQNSFKFQIWRLVPGATWFFPKNRARNDESFYHGVFERSRQKRSVPQKRRDIKIYRQPVELHSLQYTRQLNSQSSYTSPYVYGREEVSILSKNSGVTYRQLWKTSRTKRNVRRINGA